jgi:acyl dehydratase
VKAGDALPMHRLTVAAAPMRVLAEILRDPNPIHLDPAAAAAAGLGPRVVNQGPANLAYILDMLAQAFPAHRIRSVESRFLASVFDGDEVEAGGTVLDADDGSIRCETWLKARGDQTAVTAVVVLTPGSAP